MEIRKTQWRESVLPLIARALEEDVGPGDLTSQAVIAPARVGRGRLRAKESGVLSGLRVVSAVFAAVDAGVAWEAHVSDGDLLRSGTEIATVKGRLASILTAERVALNFLQHLSGIASHTRRYVERLQGSRTRLLDTRKTVPGLRLLEKAAVRDGGGTNHRMGLYDAMMIKDNHIDAAGGIAAALDAVAVSRPTVPVIVEVRSLEELALAARDPVSRVLLDNFTPEEVARAVEQLARRPLADRRIEVEVSGGITLGTIASFALPGVDWISVGDLTHSAPALDISLDIESDGPR